MYTRIREYCEGLQNEFHLPDTGRKELLGQIAGYVTEKVNAGQEARLIYICTHNSRRSHFGQVWAMVAAHYYEIPGIHAFSGGTEATAFNTNAISALQRIGFKIEVAESGKNPLYHVFYDDHESPLRCFSKVYDHPENPGEDFAAMMTCSDAEENCPYIPGAGLRIATAYADPKEFDGTETQDQMYDERCRQIARETFYLFSVIKHQISS
jgi:arsenate reductase (thioredoxin)